MPEDPTRPTSSPRGSGDRQPTRDADAGRGAAAGRPVAAEALPLSQLVGRVVIGAIAILFVVFAVFNRQPVDFSWVFGETQVVEEGGEYVRGGVPLIVLLIGSFVLGGVVTAGLLWRRRRVRRVRQGTEEGG